MRLGAYIFSGLIYILFAAGLSYTVTAEDYTVAVAGIQVKLPIALWIALPLVIFYLLSILHIAYYGTRGFFKRRKWIRDADELKDALYWALLKEPKEHHYTIGNIKECAPLLNISMIETKGTVQGLSDKLMDALEISSKIENGEYVDLKAKKISRFLSPENPLSIQNHLNRLRIDKPFREQVLQARESYDESVVSEALSLMVEDEDLFKLKKYIPQLRKEHFFRLLERADNGEDIGWSVDLVENFATGFDLNCKEYMRLLKSTIKKFAPDENLSLFKSFADKTPKAQNAYLYMLFEYEMLDGVKRFLEEHDEQEFKTFRAFYILKRGKYNYKIENIVNADNACDET